ncbi:MAG: tetratricopeptide repeat protein [Spirochaetaceae bacterium]|jgi:tetratricopeptide (TPR) repeat protein|nr:tetratricopeptide repeat protein [Spirochaetaceae bacterium]
MPSLKQLEEFRDSFLSIGGEAEAREALRLGDDYPLPENEPSGPDPFASLAREAAEKSGDPGLDAIFRDAARASPDTPFSPDTATPDTATPEIAGEDPLFAADGDAIPGDGDDFDFGSLLGGFGGDFDAGTDVPSAPAGAGLGDLGGDAGLFGADETGEAGNNDDFVIPGDLLSGFAEDVEQGRAEASGGGEIPDITDDFAPGVSDGDEDLDNFLGDFDGSIPDEDASVTEHDGAAGLDGLDLDGADGLFDFNTSGGEGEAAGPGAAGMDDGAAGINDGADADVDSFDLDIPGDINLSDDANFGSANFGDANFGDGSADDGSGEFGDINLDGFGDIASGDEGVVLSGGEDGETAGFGEDFAIPDELADGDANFGDGNFGDANFGDGSGDDETSPFADFDGAFVDNAPSAAEDGAESPGGGADDFSVPELDENGNPSEWGPSTPAGEEPDSFDKFDVDEGASTLSPDMGTAISGEGESFGTGDDDFSIAGLDDIIKGSAVKTTPQAAESADGKAKRSGRRARTGGTERAEPGVKSVEEINLSGADFEKLNETLAGYPLNLRVAVEEIIAEQVVAPDQLSALLRLLVRGAPAKETAALAGQILGRSITVPRGFEKRTGAELEAEQAQFSYIFVHKFLPLAGLFLFIALSVMCLVYLAYEFIYTPLHARSLYRIGYERIFAGEYERANERFTQAVSLHRVKNWFYRYAEAFRDERQYIYAEQKYDELLAWYPRDKKGALDYAHLETVWLRNYKKAVDILNTHILDYAPDDEAALTAYGDAHLAWGETEPERYEEARRAYARLLEVYGWKDPVVERMLLYFIRTGNLGEVISLQRYFDEANKRKIGPRTLAEMGGYLLDKRLEEPEGVPDIWVPEIQGLRQLLLRAVNAGPDLPEAHYHLARYYRDFGDAREERLTLARALSVFDAAEEESARRIRYRIDAERRMAESLINTREFIPAEQHLVKAVGLYEDARSRNRLAPEKEFGRLYAGLGDLEYFTKTGDMETALARYARAGEHGWAPPEIRYRMGSAHYHLGNWEAALSRFFSISAEMPRNRKLLHALGNAAYARGDYHAAEGYFRRLLDLLEAERARFSTLDTAGRPDHRELAERLMAAENNLGAALEALTISTGNPAYRATALGLYAESARAWDALTRDPETMVRSGAGALSSPGINLAYLNARNLLYPQPGHEPDLYVRIDKDVLDPSRWEDLAPQGYHISGLD